MNKAKTAVLFPGQGSQYVGMGRELAENDEAAMKIMTMAQEVSGLPIVDLCFNGPMEELTRAENLQPAMTAVNMVCWQAAAKAGLRADYFAGHSLGEYSALWAAGALSAEDTIRLVSARGRIMAAAGAENPGGMLAILGLDIETVEAVLARMDCDAEISIGNYNSSRQIVVSGTAAAVRRAGELAVEQGGKAIPLPVSIANHSPLMAAAVPEFEKILGATALREPQTPVLFNVTAAEAADPDEIRTIMARQVVSMVRWLEIINALRALGVKTFIEVGPKKVLTGLMRRILPKGADCVCCQIDSLETLNNCRRDLPALFEA